MMKSSHLILIFIPAILLVFVAFTIRANQYEPLHGNNAAEQVATDKEISVAIFGDDPIIGKKSAPITIISFEDFGCESCAQQMKLIRQLLDKYPDKVKFVFKGLSTTRIPHSSEEAHEYGYCANKVGKFTEFEQLAFANSRNLNSTILESVVKDLNLDTPDFRSCLNSNLASTYKSKVEAQARSLRIQSVPAIFIDGKQIRPPTILAQWQSILGLE